MRNWRSHLGLDRPRARWSASVEKDGPAAKAGLQPGDVILGVNSKPIERYGELSGSIAAIEAGRGCITGCLARR